MNLAIAILFSVLVLGALTQLTPVGELVLTALAYASEHPQVQWPCALVAMMLTFGLPKSGPRRWRKPRVMYA